VILGPAWPRSPRGQIAPASELPLVITRRICVLEVIARAVITRASAGATQILTLGISMMDC
jgi:hypothetical protein